MRRGAMDITADVSGFGVAVMAAAACVIIHRRLRSVLVIFVRVGFHVGRYVQAGDDTGVHSRFGHGHHAGLERGHEEQDKRKRGTKPRNMRKSMLTWIRHCISFDTSSGSKSRCATVLLFRRNQT
jgi:hypothetical protein